MAILGFGLILVAIALLVVVNIMPLRTEDEQVPNGHGGYKTLKAHPTFLTTWTAKRSLIVGLLGGLVLLINSAMFYAEPGTQYFIVGPTGSKHAVTTEGYKFVLPFSKVQAWQKYIDVKVIGPKDSLAHGLNEIEGKMDPIGIRFIDQVTADAYISARFELPSDEQDFIKLAIKFRSMSNLVNNTLIPTVREQMINTGYMFAAQNYISGDAQSFRQTFEEQLKGGAYAVNKTEYRDTVFDNSIQLPNTPRSIKEIKTTYQVNKLIRDGKAVRIPHEISENNILVSQVIVDDIDLEGKFKTRLGAQRDESSKRQLEQQKIETAKSSQQRILAEGERDKAQERVNQEKEQVKALIAIETKLKQESTNKELAAINLETEKLKAAAEKVKADAESYKNSKLVKAGLTPQERAEWDYKKAVGVAEKLAGPDGITFPTTYITSGGSGKGNQSSDMMMMLLLQMMQQNQKKD
jgi:hypothetical protein